MLGSSGRHQRLASNYDVWKDATLDPLANALQDQICRYDWVFIDEPQTILNLTSVQKAIVVV